MVCLFPANHTALKIFISFQPLSTLSHPHEPTRCRATKCLLFPKLLNSHLIYVNGVCHLSISSSSIIHTPSFSSLCVFERVVGLSSEIVSVRLWSVRRIFLNLLRMKCRCPYSASAMIGHAHSVERLYPVWGKHELQSSHLWGVSTLNSALAMTGADASVNFVGIFIDR